MGSGVDALVAATVDVDAPGVVTGDRVVKAFAGALVEALGWHRHWER